MDSSKKKSEEINMIWYPYTQMKTMDEPIEIVGAEGVYLHTKDKKIIDTTTSWWSVIHGYNNPEINEVLRSKWTNFPMLCWVG